MTLYYQKNRKENPRYEITRVLTNTALRQLNLKKKIFLIQFLYNMAFAKRERLSPYGFAETVDEKHLQGTILNYADFSNSNLEGCDFTDSVLTGGNFSQTNLIAARFFNTQLHQTDFRGASLVDAQFIPSNLLQSNINDEQLRQALALFNKILPNGTYPRNKTFLINGDGKQGMYGLEYHNR